ncbi:MAG: tetratricopeptide repeat protein [Balneolaceae bacterium]
MKFQKLFEELKRRNVFRVATAYVIAGWLIIQICATTFPYLNLPEWLITAVIIFVLIGFPLSLIFAWAFELTPDGLKKSVEVDITESVTSATGKKLNGIIISVLSVSLFFILVERVFFAKASILEDANLTAQIETASIAVLPFVNMSGDIENEYFSDGLSEELLNALAKVEDMKVAGRTSSFKFKGQNENLQLIGDELNVNHILEGSVRKSGGRVRITAQLIKVDDGFHMWSDTFDRELTANNIFEIQEEISRKVLGELKVRLLPEEEAELNNIPTQDIEAYQAYLKGNQLLINRNYDEIEASIALYKDAIRLDPTFASAYAQLAIAYNLQGYYGNISLDEVKENMKPNIDRALAMNSDLAEAHAAMGLYYDNEGDIDNAIIAFKRSLELNPNIIDVYNWIGNDYADLGKIEEQMEWYSKGYDIDPLNPMTIYNRVRVSLEEEDYDEVEFFMEKNIRINPDFIPTYYLRGNIQMGSPHGRIDEATKYYLQVYNSDNDFPRAISLLTFTGVIMDLPKMAGHYYKILKENYEDSFEYRSAIGAYERYKGNYSDYDIHVLQFLEESGFIPRDNFTYYDLFNYGMITDGIDKVLPLFERFDSGLFADTLSVLEERNSGQAFSLSILLNQKGNTEQAKRISDAYCLYTERSLSGYEKGTADLLYRADAAACALSRQEMKEVHNYLRLMYEEDRDVVNVFSWLRDIEEFIPDLFTDELKELQSEVQADLDMQRANLISWLKAEGEWKEEWEVEETKN